MYLQGTYKDKTMHKYTKVEGGEGVVLLAIHVKYLYSLLKNNKTYARILTIMGYFSKVPNPNTRINLGGGMVVE